jgi:ABC transporter substrate binding protein
MVVPEGGATSTVPIVFTTGGDPIKLGLVASLRRPGGNVTGSTQLSVEVGPKRLELARELFPGATTFALLVNPANPLAATVSKDLEAVADTLGMRLHVLHASTEADLGGRDQEIGCSKYRWVVFRTLSHAVHMRAHAQSETGIRVRRFFPAAGRQAQPSCASRSPRCGRALGPLQCRLARQRGDAAASAAS